MLFHQQQPGRVERIERLGHQLVPEHLAAEFLGDLPQAPAITVRLHPCTCLGGRQFIAGFEQDQVPACHPIKFGEDFPFPPVIGLDGMRRVHHIGGAVRKRNRFQLAHKQTTGDFSRVAMAAADANARPTEVEAIDGRFRRQGQPGEDGAKRGGLAHAGFQQGARIERRQRPGDHLGVSGVSGQEFGFVERPNVTAGLEIVGDEDRRLVVGAGSVRFPQDFGDVLVPAIRGLQVDQGRTRHAGGSMLEDRNQSGLYGRRSVTAPVASRTNVMTRL